MEPVRSPLWRATDVRQARLRKLDAAASRAEEVASTGLKVLRPSDAPGRWGEIGAIRERQKDQGVYKENLNLARVPVNVAERALGEVTNVLSEAKALAVQTASETYDPDRRPAAAAQVQALRARLVGLANTKAGDRYVFSGDQNETPAFDDTGTYLGGTGSPAVLVGDDRWLETAWNGSEVFTGSVDAFAVLDDFEAALTANDPDAIAALFTNLDASIEQSINWRQDAGLRQEVVEDATIVADNLDVLFAGQLSDLVGADPTTALTDLAEARDVYNRALQITATSGKRSLFDFLG